jgi:hypothetical protein
MQLLRPTLGAQPPFVLQESKVVFGSVHQVRKDSRIGESLTLFGVVLAP